MEKNRLQIKWLHGLLWIVLNTVGRGMYIILAGVIGWIVWQIYQFLSGMGVYFLSDESTRLFVSGIVLGVCMGTIIGFLQYFVLKNIFEIQSKKWVLATLIGITFGLAINFALPDPTSIRNFSLSFYQTIRIIVVIVSSISLGVSQWMVLRKIFSRAEWWIVAAGVAHAITNLINSRVSYGGENYLRFSLLFLFVEGFGYGVLTLIVLLAILRRLDTISLSE